MRSNARANRRDLLEAAERLLNVHGPTVSLRAVAQEAGVGVGTLYRHFPTRRHLLTALLGQILEKVDAIVDGYLAEAGEPEDDDGATASDGDLARVRWHRFATELVGVNLTVAAASLDSLDRKDLPSEDMIEAAEKTLLQRMEDVLARARADRLVSEDLTGERFFMGLLTVSRPLLSEERWRLPGQEDWMLRTYLRGLRPQG